PLVITRTTFTNNANTALSVLGPGKVTVRGSIFNTHPRVIYLAAAAGGIDLGSGDGSGGNGIRICDNCDGIFDDRTGGGQEFRPIPVTGVTFFRSVLPIILLSGCSDTDSPKDSPYHFWRITNPGTCPSTGNVIIN